MFDEIIEYTNNHKLQCTIYVDDITVSSINRYIAKKEEAEIKNIIRKHKQKLSKGKTIRYGANEYKKVTGFNSIVGLTNFANISVNGKFRIKS